MRLISEFAWAVATIWQEARGEPQAGRIAVGNVIRNRCQKHGRTVAEIVLAPLQFSGWNTRDPNRTPSALLDDTDEIVRDCAKAWLDSEEMPLVEDATLYCNLDLVNPPWLSGVTQICRIGHHTFFAERVTQA